MDNVYNKKPLILYKPAIGCEQTTALKSNAAAYFHVEPDARMDFGDVWVFWEETSDESQLWSSVVMLMLANTFT